MTIATPAELRAAHTIPATVSDETLVEIIASAESMCEAYLGQPLERFNPMPVGLRKAILQIAADLCNHGAFWPHPDYLFNLLYPYRYPTIVTLAELRAQGNLPDIESSALLAQKIAAAEDWCAGYLGRPLSEFVPLPAGIREAVLRIAADLYENREASLVGVSASALPFGVADLLAPHRAWVF